MAQDLTLHVVGASPHETANLTFRLAEELSNTGTIQASIATRPGTEGERGADVPLWGQLALTFVGGGAASTLLNVLAAWIPKRSDQTIEFKDGRGREFKITGADLTPEKLGAILQTLDQFVVRARRN